MGIEFPTDRTCELLIHILTIHPHSVFVLAAGFYATASFPCNDNVARRLTGVGVCELILQCAQPFVYSEAITENATFAIARCFRQNEEVFDP